MDAQSAAALEIQMVQAEMDKQDFMWGAINERADTSRGQLMEAAIASTALVLGRNEMPRTQADYPTETLLTDDELIESIRSEIYPGDWSGFRDYGSDVANLVVAVAYLRQQIRAKVRADEPVHRTSRRPDQPYLMDQPRVQ